MPAIEILPVELLRDVRDCIFEISSREYLISELNVELNTNQLRQNFFREESQWSWRNFLSANNSASWKFMRTSTMFWNLNCHSSQRYLTDENFRNFVNAGMRDPCKQLRLNLYKIELDLKGNLGVNLLANSNSSLFYAGGLCSLSLKGCQTITHLGDFKSLKVLEIISCCKLQSVGRMDSLLNLTLCDVSDSFFPAFPFEQLRKVDILDNARCTLTTAFIAAQARCLDLTELSICASTLQYAILPRLHCQKLEILKLTEFYAIDLTGLPNLKSFYTENCLIIIGKAEAYPRLEFLYSPDDPEINGNPLSLKSLKSWRYANAEVTIPPIHRCFSEVELICPNANVRKFSVDENIKTLTLVAQVVEVELKNPDQQLSGLYLSSPTLIFFPEIKNIYIVELYQAPVRKISPLKHVPCLTVALCGKVDDFGCLGAQRYLTIVGCHLTNSDIHSFTKVPSLTIIYCNGITEVQKLIRTRYLRIGGCNRLNSIHLEGKDYVSVRLFGCSLLTSIIVTGHVYSLCILECNFVGTVDKENCSYLLNDEVMKRLE
jgi:hypothetical protein